MLNSIESRRLETYFLVTVRCASLFAPESLAITEAVLKATQSRGSINHVTEVTAVDLICKLQEVRRRKREHGTMRGWAEKRQKVSDVTDTRRLNKFC